MMLNLKNFTISAILLFSNLSIFAEESTDYYFTIKVVDVYNEFIVGAKITIDGLDESYYTNIRGECKIPESAIKKGNINIDFISYKSNQIKITSRISKVTLESR
jgi:hypothetical protein